jgi:uroporphyrinogen-III synthase
MLFRLRGGFLAGNTPDMAIQAIQHRPIVVLSRPKAQAERFAQRIDNLQANIIFSPIMEISNIQIEEMPPNEARLIFSSASAVSSASEQFDLSGRVGYAVGQSTAEELKAQGFRVLITAPDGARLLAAIAEEAPTSPLIHVSGNQMAVDLAAELSKLGHLARSVCVYRQDPLPISEELVESLHGDAAHVFPLFSPRAANLLSRELGSFQCRAPIHLVSMSKAVDISWSGPEPASRCLASHPDAESMMEQIRACIDRLT